MIQHLLLLCLAAGTGSDDYQTREHNSRALARLTGTRESYELLSRVANGHPDPEVRVRCRRAAALHLSDAVDEFCPLPLWPLLVHTSIRPWEYTELRLGDWFPDRENYLAFDGEYKDWYGEGTRLATKGEVMRYIRHTGDWKTPATVLAAAVGTTRRRWEGEQCHIVEANEISFNDFFQVPSLAINWRFFR